MFYCLDNRKLPQIGKSPFGKKYNFFGFFFPLTSRSLPRTSI